jgi:hypothetical protein
LNPAHVRYRKRLAAARYAVERAAERYAIALRAYQTAIFAEFAISAPKSLRPAPRGKCRMGAWGMTTVVSVPGRKHPGHAEESFGVDSRVRLSGRPAEVC